MIVAICYLLFCIVVAICAGFFLYRLDQKYLKYYENTIDSDNAKDCEKRNLTKN